FGRLSVLFLLMGADRRPSPAGDCGLGGRHPLGAAAGGTRLGGARLGALGVAGAALVLVGTGWGRRSVQRAAD
ncbi:EamA family transporter, partial [Streptomyces sp. NPDC059586]